MLKHMRSRLAQGLAAIAICSLGAAADDPDISELAPQRSFLVVSVPDWTGLARSFESSDLGALWREDSVQTFIEKVMEDPSKDFGDFLKEVNIELDDLAPPTGQVGLALYLPDPFPEREPWDTSVPTPHALLAADLGEHADAWEQALERLIEHGLSEKRITTDEETFAGVEIRIIRPVYEDAEAQDDGGDDEMEFEAEEEFGGIGGLLGGSTEDPRNLYIGRVGTTLLAATEIATLESAIDALSGQHPETIADSQDFRDAALQRSGGAGGGAGATDLAYAAFFPGSLLGPMMKNDPEGGEAFRIFDALGIGKIRAVSMGLRLDTQDALAEATLAVLAPEKEGLLKLFQPAGGGFEPPAFVSPDAADISSFYFDFAAIPGLVRSFARAMPEDQQQMILGGFEQMSNIIVPTLEAMGPGVHTMTSYRQPLSGDSPLMTVAIDLKDPAVVANTITFITGQIPGVFAPREFEGNTIYASEGGGGVPFAFGIGFGRLFIGEAAAVENAMRLAGAAEGDVDTLAESDRFREAARALAPGGVAYSYTDLEQTLRWTYWEFENAVALAEKEIEDAGGWGFDEEERAEYLKAVREAQPAWASHLPPLEVLLRYLGDSATEMQPTPDGFRGRTLILRRGD